MAELEYPIPKFRFEVDFGDYGTISFQEVSGLEMEIEMIEYRVGDSPLDTKQKIPGLQKTSNVSFKRGVCKGRSELYEWFNSVRDMKNQIGEFENQKKEILIHLMDTTGQPVFSWKLVNAFPLKMSAPDLNAEGNEIAIESIELAHEGIYQEMVA